MVWGINRENRDKTRKDLVTKYSVVGPHDLAELQKDRQTLQKLRNYKSKKGTVVPEKAVNDMTNLANHLDKLIVKTQLDSTALSSEKKTTIVDEYEAHAAKLPPETKGDAEFPPTHIDDAIKKFKESNEADVQSEVQNKQARIKELSGTIRPVLDKLKSKAADLVARYPLSTQGDSRDVAFIMDRISQKLEEAYTNYIELATTSKEDFNKECLACIAEVSVEMQTLFTTHRSEVWTLRKWLDEILTYMNPERKLDPNRWFKPATADTFEETKKAIDTLKPPTP